MTDSCIQVTQFIMRILIVEDEPRTAASLQQGLTQAGYSPELSGRGDDFVPLAVDRSIDSLYFLDKLDGRAALYRMKLDGSEAKTLVASRPDVDIDDAATADSAWGNRDSTALAAMPKPSWKPSK